MNPTQLTIYFHIGQPKTGSSAIQAFLNMNRELLAKKFHILYPTNEPPYESGNQESHLLLFEKIKTTNDYSYHKKLIEAWVSYAKTKKYQKIIISNEAFSSWKNFTEVIYSILKDINVNFKIILYLRRQDYYLESAWKQWGIKDPAYKTIQEYALKRRLSMDWHKFVLMWLNFFNVDDFIIRPFEKEVIGLNIINDFLGIIGIDSVSQASSFKNLNLRINQGFAPEVTEILKLCNYLAGDIHDNQLADILERSLSEKFIKQSPFESYRILSQKERYDIIQYYDESNRKLAKLIWGSTKENLFVEQWPDPNEMWETKNALTMEKIVPFFVELFLYQQRQIQSIKENHQQNVGGLHQMFKSLKKGTLQLKKKLIEVVANFSLKDGYKKAPNTSFCIEENTNLKFNGLQFEHILAKCKIRNHISSWSLSDAELIIVSEGNDPYFVLPKSLLIRNMKAITFEVTVPDSTVFEVFYKTRRFSHFKRENSIKKILPQGRNSVKVILPIKGVSGSLRIDIGTIPGKYYVHKIMIGR